MKTSLPHHLGFPWFRREHYAKARKIFEDGHKLPSTFDQWQKRAQRSKQEFERKGHTVVKAYIDPDTFPTWCSDRGLNIDASARRKFASFVAAEYLKKH